MVYSDAGQIVTSDFHWTIGRPNAVRRNCNIPNQKALGSGIPKWWGSRSADEKYRNSAPASECSRKTQYELSAQTWSVLTVGIPKSAKVRWIHSTVILQCIMHRICDELWIHSIISSWILRNWLRKWVLEAHFCALFLYFSSADLVRHHFGMPEPRAFWFGMVQFLRTAFGLPIVQWKSVVTICPASRYGLNH